MPRTPPIIPLLIVDDGVTNNDDLSKAVLRAIIVCLILFILFLILLMLYRKNRYAMLYAFFRTSGHNPVDQHGHSQPTSPSFDSQIHPMQEMPGTKSLAYPPLVHHTFYA